MIVLGAILLVARRPASPSAPSSPTAPTRPTLSVFGVSLSERQRRRPVPDRRHHRRGRHARPVAAARRRAPASATSACGASARSARARRGETLEEENARLREELGATGRTDTHGRVRRRARRARAPDPGARPSGSARAAPSGAAHRSGPARARPPRRRRSRLSRPVRVHRDPAPRRPVPSRWQPVRTPPAASVTARGGRAGRRLRRGATRDAAVSAAASAAASGAVPRRGDRAQRRRAAGEQDHHRRQSQQQHRSRPGVVRPGTRHGSRAAVRSPAGSRQPDRSRRARPHGCADGRRTRPVLAGGHGAAGHVEGRQPAQHAAERPGTEARTRTSTARRPPAARSTLAPARRDRPGPQPPPASGALAPGDHPGRDAGRVGAAQLRATPRRGPTRPSPSTTSSTGSTTAVSAVTLPRSPRRSRRTATARHHPSRTIAASSGRAPDRATSRSGRGRSEGQLEGPRDHRLQQIRAPAAGDHLVEHAAEAAGGDGADGVLGGGHAGLAVRTREAGRRRTGAVRTDVTMRMAPSGTAPARSRAAAAGRSPGACTLSTASPPREVPGPDCGRQRRMWATGRRTRAAARCGGQSPASSGPTSPTTTGTTPSRTKAGRKHSPSGATARTPTRSAAA